MNALTLLITAMQLLTAVGSNPNLPQSFKDQAITMANYAIQVAQAEIMKSNATPEVKSIKEYKPSILKLRNSLGIEYEFYDVMTNQQRVRDLLSVGFKVVQGELPDIFIPPTMPLGVITSPTSPLK